MDPRRRPSSHWRVLLTASTVVLVASLGPVACRPPAGPGHGADPHHQVVELHATGETPAAAAVLDRLATARTGRTWHEAATYLPPVGTADADPPAGAEPAMTTRVEAAFDRDASVLQGRTTVEAHQGSEEIVGHLPEAFTDGGVSFEVYAEGQAPLLARLVAGHPLGGPVPSPWRDVDAVAEVVDLDEQIRAPEDVLALLQEAVEQAPPVPVGSARWRGSVAPGAVVALGTTGGPLVLIAGLAAGLPAEVVGDAIRYELSDLGDRVRAVIWLDVDDMSARLGEQPVGAPLMRCVVEWFDLDRPIDLWDVEVADPPSSP